MNLLSFVVPTSKCPTNSLTGVKLAQGPLRKDFIVLTFELNSFSCSYVARNEGPIHKSFCLVFLGVELCEFFFSRQDSPSERGQFFMTTTSFRGVSR